MGDANTSGKIPRRAIARQSVTHTQRSNEYVSQVKKKARCVARHGDHFQNPEERVQTYHMVTSVVDPCEAHRDASFGDPPPEPPLPLPLPGNDLQRPCLPRATGCGAEGSGDLGAHRANEADGAEGHGNGAHGTLSGSKPFPAVVAVV